MLRWPGTLKLGFLAAFAGLILSACAGGFSEDRSQTIITTEPTEARCTLEGKNFSATVQTPARVALPKEAAPVTLSCGASGHRTFVTTLRPRFNEKVFGNLLLGSLTGMIVDMANGHGTKYPERVHVHMEPSAFATVETRDRWFSRYRGFIAHKWDRINAELTDSCKADDDSYDCLARRKIVAANRAQELQELERRRHDAHIDAMSTAERPAAGATTQ